MAINLQGNNTSTYSDDVAISGDLSATVIRSGGNPDNGANIGAYYGPGYSAICRNGAQNVYTVYQQGTVANTAAIFADGSAVFGNKAAGPNITLNADGTISSSNSNNSWIERNWTGAPGDAQAYTGFQVKNNGTTVWKIACDGTTYIGGTDINSPNIKLESGGAIYADNVIVYGKGSDSSHYVRFWSGDGGSGNRAQFFTNNGSSKTAMITSLGEASKVGGGSWASISDSRSKNSIAPYTSGLAELSQVETVKYKYNGLGKEYVGVIAQQVESVMPELVSVSPGTTYDGTEIEDLKSVDPTPLTFALVNAVKEMATRIEALEAQLSQLTTTGGASS